MTKPYDITTTMVSAEFVNLEATKPLFEIRAAWNNANKFCATPLKVAFRNSKLEDLRSFTEKGSLVPVHDTTNNSAVQFPAVAYSVDIIKLLLGKRMSVKLTNLYDENPQHISVGCGNLEARKTVVEGCAALNNGKKIWCHSIDGDCTK